MNRRPVVAVAIAGLLCAPPLGAQSVEALEARLRRVDSLVAARRAEFSATRARRESPANTRVRAGAFVMQVPADLAPIAREAGAAAWRAVAPRGGRWLEAELARRPVRVTMETWPRPLGPVYRSATLILQPTAAGEDDSQLARSVDAAGLRDGLIALVEGSARRALRLDQAGAEGDYLRTVAEVSGPGLSVALATPGLGSPPLLSLLTRDVSEGAAAWAVVRELLALVPARTNRECLAGNPRSCLVSLGLDDSVPPTPARWFDPSDYQWLVASDRMAVAFLDPTPLKDQCLRDRSERACVTLIDRHARAVTPPATGEALSSLCALALELGGPEALVRLTSSTGPFAERLSIAAGRPLAEVMATWQQRVAGAPRRPHGPAGFTLLAGVLLSAALLAFATGKAP